MVHKQMEDSLVHQSLIFQGLSKNKNLLFLSAVVVNNSKKGESGLNY